VDIEFDVVEDTIVGRGLPTVVHMYGSPYAFFVGYDWFQSGFPHQNGSG
jgi:hypothetical protein